MAFSLLCRHCGHQEPPHAKWDLCSEEDICTLNEGYQYILSSCPGFEYQEEDKKLVTEFQMRDLLTRGSHEGQH